MIPSRVKSVGLAVVLSIAFAGIGGCTDNPLFKSQKKAVNSIVDTRTEVIKAQNSLEQTLASLDKLESNTGGDVKPAYDQLKEAFADTQKHAEKARERAVAFRERRDDYLKEWEEEVSKINNPELKTTGEQRVAAVRERFGAIHDVAQNCRDAYDPFVKDLTDIQNYLGANLTPAGVDKAKPTIAVARKDGRELMGKLNDLVLQMNVVSADLTPTGKVPEKKTIMP